jgi:hypothetical protein
MHLTLGVYARTGIDFLSWLVDELREDVQWRETFPLTLDWGMNTETPKTIAHFAKLRHLLMSKMNEPRLLGEFRRFCVALERRLDQFDFPSQLVRDVSISKRSAFRRPSYQQVFFERREDTGMIEITVWGKILKFGGSAESLLRLIFSKTTFTAQELLDGTPTLSWNDISTVLSSLTREEIVKIVE